jgi:hypothetical protein
MPVQAELWVEFTVVGNRHVRGFLSLNDCNEFATRCLVRVILSEETTD